MKFFRVITAFMIILAGCGTLQAQQTQNTFDFLRMDLNPRAAALAGSLVAGTDDPNVIFYNPAGINSLDNMPVSFSYVKHLLDINLGGLSLVKNFQDIGHFGFAVNYINYGTFTKADEFANRLGEAKAGEVAFILGYGNKLDENFFYGANVKFIYSSIIDRSSTAYAVDLGLQYLIPSQSIAIGLSGLNMGRQIKSYYDLNEDLPFDVRIGISKKMERIPVKLFLSFNRINDKQTKFADHLSTFSFGTEFNLSKVLRLRLGYDNEKRKELKMGTTAGLAGFNIGVGALIKGYNFDYSYSSLGLVGSLSRIGITTTF
ncbi:MAG: type IX secretion system protein PorQ [Methanococcaceae archaeon]